MQRVLVWFLVCFFSAACAVPLGPTGDEGDKVVNGDDASIADHPWAVMLHWQQRDDFPTSADCGGTLISPRVVLTAAHCLQGRSKEALRIVAGEDFSVGLEAWDVRLLEVDDWEVHESYLQHGESGDPADDLAVIWLAEDAPEGSEPARLWEGAESMTPSRARVLGWGRTETRATSTSLRSKEVALVSIEDAPITPRLRERWRNLVVTEGDGGGFCQGDSGGPLESLDEPGVILGVLSRTANTGTDGERLAPCHVGAAVPSWRAAAWLRSLGVLLEP